MVTCHKINRINKRFKYLLFLVALLSTINFAQNGEYLRQYRNKSLADTVRLGALYDLIWDKLYTDIDSAEKLVNLGLNNPLTAKQPLFKSKFFNAYGAISQTRYDYLSALNYYQNGLRINEEYNDLKGQAVMLGNIGSIYIKLKQTSTALNYQRKCLSVLKKINDEINQAPVYNNLCVIQTEMQNYELAMQYALISKDLYEKSNDKNGITSCYANIGSLYEKLNELDKALVNYKIAAGYAKETDNMYEYTRTLSECGNILFLQGKYSESIKYLQEAKQVALENDDIEALAEIYDFLHLYYKKQNNPKFALEFFEKSSDLKDSISAYNKKDEITRLRFENEYARKTTKDSIDMANERVMNSEKLKAKNAQISKAKTEKTAFIVFIVLLVVVSIIIYNRFKLTQRQKHIIEAKNKQTEEQKLIIEEKQKEIVDSINYAKRIQDSLLDNFETVKRFFDNAFVLNKPKDIVSGDFYWISKKISTTTKHSENKSTVTEMFYVAVCDSTGHGVPGGFMSLLNMAYLSESLNEKSIYEPNKIFDYVRERLINTISKNDQKDGFDGVLMRFEKHLHFENKTLSNTAIKLTYAAAHNSPILIRNKALVELEKDKMPVGYGERKDLFRNFEVDLKPGDQIFVYTDGYPDQFGGPRGKKYKYKQLNELLLAISSTSMDEHHALLTKSFEDWQGNIEQVDDVCMIGIKI